VAVAVRGLRQLTQAINFLARAAWAYLTALVDRLFFMLVVVAEVR
jgi:hypothetical protein